MGLPKALHPGRPVQLNVMSSQLLWEAKYPVVGLLAKCPMVGLLAKYLVVGLLVKYLVVGLLAKYPVVLWLL